MKPTAEERAAALAYFRAHGNMMPPAAIDEPLAQMENAIQEAVQSMPGDIDPRTGGQQVSQIGPNGRLYFDETFVPTQNSVIHVGDVVFYHPPIGEPYQVEVTKIWGNPNEFPLLNFGPALTSIPHISSFVGGRLPSGHFWTFTGIVPSEVNT